MSDKQDAKPAKRKLRTPMDRVLARREAGWGGRHVFVWTDEIRAKVVQMFKDGSTSTEIDALPFMPSVVAQLDEQKRNPEFAAAVQEARAYGAKAMLDEANDLARQVAVADEDGTINVDNVRAAEAYARTINGFVEKVAPREYGPLLKLGADADAGAMPIIQIVSFAKDAKEAKQTDETSG